jgi:hypothetical protein
MSEIKCKKYDSNKIIQNAKITDFGHGNIENNLSIYIQSTDRAFFNKSIPGEILAQVWANCGDLILKVQNLNELWKAHTKSIK